MLIACEKCSTTYVLDDNLIPAQGAPVQCTRCSHVFIAKPPDAPAASPTSGRAGPGDQTMLDAPQGRGVGGQTMMFGGVAGGEAAAPQPQGVPSSTMMFGAVNAGAAPAAPQAKPASGTMVFGAVNAGAAPPAAQAKPASGTMVFGAVSAGAAPAPQAKPASGTMVFGAVGANPAPAAAPAAKPPAQTAMFGVAPQIEPAKPASGTMVFGAVSAAPPAVEPAKPASGTMVFGAVSATPAAAKPPAHTAMFGVPQVAPAQPPAGGASSTMMFGAVGASPAPAAAPAKAPAATAMFGAVQAPAAAPAAPPAAASSTMMFGAVAAAPAAAPPPAAAPAPKQTVMFGVPQTGGSAKNLPKVTAGGAQAAGQASQDRNESTVRVDPVHVMQEQDRPNPGIPKGTQMFAMSAPSAQAAEADGAHDGVDGAEPTIQGMPPPEMMQPVPRQTVMFAGNTRPGTEPSPPSVHVEPSVASPAASPGADSVSLPPEPASLPGLGQPAPAAAAGEEDFEAALRGSSKRRTTVAFLLIGLIALAAVLFIGWKAFGPRLTGSAVPAETKAATAEALSKLKFDDGASKHEAVAALQGVVASQPQYVEGHAALVLAMALDFDDVQQRVVRLQRKYNAVRTKLEAAQKDTSESGRREGEVLGAQVNEISKTHRELLPGAEAAQQKLQAAATALQQHAVDVEPGSAEDLAVTRARAMLKAVSGDVEALGLAERAKAMAGGDADQWLKLVPAEYATNAQSGSREEALKQVTELVQKASDASMIRAYVLAARLHVLADNFEAAQDELGKVLAMRKGHEVATELLEWAKKEAAAK